MIKPGDNIPSAATWHVTGDDSVIVNVAEWLAEGKHIFFSLPGAFTPTCHNHHLPGFVANADKLKSLGIDKIICASVNDPHVMRAWAKAQNAFGKIEFLADFDASLALDMGLSRDLSATGLGQRFMRSAMIIERGIVSSIFVDSVPGQLTNTSASSIMGVLRSQHVKELQDA